jgi:hypothetical protein
MRFLISQSYISFLQTSNLSGQANVEFEDEKKSLRFELRKFRISCFIIDGKVTFM